MKSLSERNEHDNALRMSECDACEWERELYLPAAYWTRSAGCRGRPTGYHRDAVPGGDGTVSNDAARDFYARQSVTRLYLPAMIEGKGAARRQAPQKLDAQIIVRIISTIAITYNT